jgi:serine/threonine protein kinase
VLHQIGNGALGPVFRAYDSDRDRLVAIKVFRVDLPPERVHQLVAEFEKLIGAELQHPVIAAPRATGIDGSNNAFLAQSFAAADSLDIVMREHGPAPIARALRVASQLAEALDYAAERQILHGALHPRDVLLSEDDIRIVGLGVSRALERVGVTSPVRRPYSAPERINDEGWDQRADVFSLAAIVYELLCGRRVTGTGSEAAESLTDVAGCDLEALRRVFALALAADPEYRFATATAFTDALKDTIAPVASVATDAGPNTPKSKPRRPRAKFRVVPPTLIDSPSEVDGLALSEVEGPAASDVEEPGLSDVEGLAPNEVEGPEIELPLREELASIEVAALPLLEIAPETADDADEFETVMRRKVPAPTPVAIETVASAPDRLLDEELLDPFIPTAETVDAVASVEPEVVSVDAVARVEDAVVEPADLFAFAETSEPVESVERVEPPFTWVEPPVEEPALAPELIELPPSPPETRLPPFLNSDFSPPFSDMPARAHSPVWPIGVAAVIGIAVGFGVGYTVAIRDRGVAAPVATSVPPSAQVAVAQPQRLTTAPATAAPAAPVVVEPLLAPPAARVPNDPAPAPTRFNGRVLVRSTPAGARVFVDGKDRGQTPATIDELGRGEHRIRIVRDGYTVAERRVVLSPTRPSQSLSVPLALEPRPQTKSPAATRPVPPAPTAKASTESSTLVVESRPPGATVLIDGRVVGTTPLSIGDVREGNHAVRIERDGYRTWTSAVTVTGGEQSRVTASLEK